MIGRSLLCIKNEHDENYTCRFSSPWICVMSKKSTKNVLKFLKIKKNKKCVFQLTFKLITEASYATSSIPNVEKYHVFCSDIILIYENGIWRRFREEKYTPVPTTEIDWNESIGVKTKK